MKRTFLLLAVVALVGMFTYGDGATRRTTRDERVAAEIRKLTEFESRLVLRGNIVDLARLYPPDFVVTNPFNQFVDKPKVLERIRTNVIRYDSYEKKIEYLRVYGDTVVTAGREVVVTAPNANRPDAGRVVQRRFTEVWVRRGDRWQPVARHASDKVEQ